MKQTVFKFILVIAIAIPNILSAKQAKNLNVLVNSANPQTQAMAMVLSLMSIKKHKANVNMVLCGAAADLANKNIKGTPIKRPNGKAPSAKQHLKMLIKLGANIEVCPLYLPNAGLKKDVLLDGVTVAKPPMVAKRLLDLDSSNITF